MTSKYKTPSAFLSALTDRLKRKSREEGIDFQRLRRMVTFDRFLLRLFHQEPSPWILKGGYAMELRVSHPRATKDIDLALKEQSLTSSDPEIQNKAILKELRIHAEIDLGDFFTFLVSEPIMDLDAAPYGGARFFVEAQADGRRFARFNLDVGVGDVLVEEPEIICGEDWLEFAGLPTKGIPALSVNQQFAEKIHAYTLPRGDRPNSRVKDLVDMLLLMRSQKLDEDKLKEAIERTFKRRKTHDVPQELDPPPENWEKPFLKLARDCELSLEINDAFLELKNFYPKIF